MSLAKILFVDDEPAVLDGVRRQLKRAGRDWELVFQTDPVTALSTVKQSAPDIIVCDLAMPGMDGIELISAMKTFAPTSKFIMLTGTADLSNAMEAINRLGIFRFYAKPCPTNILIEGLDAALADLRPSEPGSGGFSIPKITEQLGAAVLNQLSMGVLVLDQQAKLVFANRRGSLLIAEADGLLLSADQICRASGTADSQKLHALMRRTIDGQGSDDDQSPMIAINRPSMKRPYSVLATLLQIGPDVPHIALFVSDPEEVPLPCQEGLKDLYGLNRAEAGLVHELVCGRRLEEAADTVGVTLSTARTYLKSIFVKTETNRQAELVKLVICSAPFTSKA